tara:strand:+ start:79 stop:369 length:291 start_codon:yes stop_codon:yes gene_type:complete
VQTSVIVVFMGSSDVDGSAPPDKEDPAGSITNAVSSDVEDPAGCVVALTFSIGIFATKAVIITNITIFLSHHPAFFFFLPALHIYRSSSTHHLLLK